MPKINWRPQGWENIKRPDDPWQGFEAGADAMLKALKKRGVKTDITNQDLSVNIMCQIDQAIINAGDNPEGTLVFIPDEEESYAKSKV